MTARDAAALPITPAAVAQRLRQSSAITLSEALTIWRARDARWQRSSSIHRLLAETVIRLGEPLLAYDIIRERLKGRPNDPQLRELEGLALTKSGATERAVGVLEALRQDGSATARTLGILARAYKDLADQAADDPTLRSQQLARSADTYLSAFKASGDYWTGINAATTALLLNRRTIAQRLARQLRTQCAQRLRGASKERYWLKATIAEASLILRDWPKAVRLYGEAAKHGSGRFGDLQSTRRNARLILRYWRREDPAIEAALRLPTVVVFAGHMIDQPQRRSERFPEQLERVVADHIGRKLETIDAGIGFSSAACGSDILFLEAMLARRAEVTVVLPTDPVNFKRDSVDIAGSKGDWGRRFERVINCASRVVIASTSAAGADGTLLQYTNDLLLGMATIRARQLDSSTLGLAVWDKSHGDGEGGTETAVMRWRQRGIQIELLNPVSLGRGEQGRRRPNPAVAQTQRKEHARGVKVMTLLFADAVGFSKLTEFQVPLFVEHVLGSIARLAKGCRQIAARNTWGDGIFFVFRTAEAAADFALSLVDLISSTDWQKIGLPGTLSMRVALHAGPVYKFSDPIMGRPSFGGTHVSRAARIEPITPPGQVYASEAFACLAVAHGCDKIAFDYAGQTPMAKDFGTFPTYHVRRAGKFSVSGAGPIPS